MAVADTKIADEATVDEPLTWFQWARNIADAEIAAAEIIERPVAKIERLDRRPGVAPPA